MHPIQPGSEQPPHQIVVLGVDTHKDVHVAVVIDVMGRLLGTEAFAATTHGYEALWSWARSHGQVSQAGVEGTGSYGAGLARKLCSLGVAVIEVNCPDRSMRRSRGKTDAVDAEAAARAVLSGRATAVPKSGDGAVEALRVFKLAKDSAVKSRTQAINQIKAVLVCADPQLREALAGLTNSALIARCAELADPTSPTVARPVELSLCLLARRVQGLSEEIRQFGRWIKQRVQDTAPDLLELHGVGPDSAAALLVAAGDNPERFSSEASFAALCGVSPVERSSGKSQRRRLNRGGDRQANAALFRIALTRLRDHPETRTYLARRTAEGRTRREIIRCLKRYLARQIFKIISTSMATTTT